MMKELIEKYKEKILTNKRSLIKAERGVSVQILTGEISAYQDIVKDLESLQSKGKNKEEVEEIYHRFVQYEWNDVSDNLKESIIKAIEYAQSHAKPTHSGKTKEQVWEEAQSYHQIEGTIPEDSRVGAAVYDAMERFANQDGCKVVPWQSCPVCNGSGQVYQPLSTGILRTCPTCNGERIIPMHVTQPQP